MPSKHLSARQLIRCGLFDNLNSFIDLERRISALGTENSKIVGDAFEIFIEAYLATHQKLQAEAVWLVGQVPQGIRQQMNLPNDAKGIDGIFRTRTGVLVPYQVKFRSQRAYLTYTQIAPFLGLTERATDRIVFTNSNELAEDVKNRDAMRTVRGIDFDDLTKDDLAAISAWLREQPVAIPKLAPRQYQIEALVKISDTLAKSDRAHVVMACGTGKTLVALWAAEALKPKMVLVLLPSLTLLQQTLDEWSRHNNWGKDFTYLCVCSDPTVTARDENDPVRLDATDLEFRVDTNPDEVQRFIERDTPEVKVVFSTYQSSHVVSEGIRELVPFDVAIFDEAHKTTGPQGGLFAHSLKDENISIRKRLFFTATDWEEGFGHSKIYKEHRGHCAVPAQYKTRDGYRLGDWVSVQRLSDKLSPERKGRLDALNFDWDPHDSAWEVGLEHFRAFVNVHKHSRVPPQYKSADGYKLGSWVIRRRFKKDTLRPEQIEMLDALSFDWDPVTTQWEEGFERLQAYVKEYKHCRVPRKYKTPDGYRLGGWVSEQRVNRDIRSPERKERLDALGFDWHPHGTAWEEGFEHLQAYVREYKECRVPQQYKSLDGYRLGGWVFKQRQKRATLSADCKARLDALGFDWEPHDRAWEEGFKHLQAYAEQFKNCRVPVEYKAPDGYRLGQWVSVQRLSCDELSSESKGRLDELNFDWDPLNTDWEIGIEHLKAYVKEFRHCRIPSEYKAPDGHRLGQWVTFQRVSQDRLPDKRKAQLTRWALNGSRVKPRGSKASDLS